MIVDHGDEARYIAALIKHGAASATTLMRRLAATPRKAGVARALTGIGQIERTRFRGYLDNGRFGASGRAKTRFALQARTQTRFGFLILQTAMFPLYPFTLVYLRDAAMQRQVQVSLNRGEAVNALARALFFGRRGIFRDQALIDQTHRASCLLILIAAIAVWNTTYLADAVEALRAEGEEIPNEILTHLSLLRWGHINLLGRYQFGAAPAWNLQQRRPLRSGEEEDDESENSR